MMEDILAAYTNPGPIDDLVLYEQDQHVSAAVWNGEERGALICHEHTSKLDNWNLTARQIELVERAGFGYFRLISGISLDNPLISAMVERWRRETNTFHLNVGEMTVTLKDVALLLGLPIDGYPVIGNAYTDTYGVCKGYLGKPPPVYDRRSGMIKLSWLKECFSHCPEDATVEAIKYHTRAYLLYLVGNTIFSTTTEDRVHVMYLPLFENFDRCGKYAWGAAALAFLYRELGNASLRSASTISGCLTLLQFWCYFYLNIGRPKLNQDLVPDRFPFVLFWKGNQTGTTANRDVVFYRIVLDSMKDYDVEWRPYRHFDKRVIPNEISHTLRLDKSKTMLIFFEKAERHLPDRCLRQLGRTLSIPKDVERWERKNLRTPGLVKIMESEINEWKEDRLRIVEKVDVADKSEYMQWYLKITRKFVGRPIIPISLSSDFQRQNDGLRDITLIFDAFSTEGLDPQQVESILKIRNIAQKCLRDLTGGSSVTSEKCNTKLSHAVVKFDAKETMNNSQLCDEPKVVMNSAISNAAENLGETQYFDTYDTMNYSQLCDEPKVVMNSAISNAAENLGETQYFDTYDTMNYSQLCDEPKVVMNSAISNAAENLGKTQYFDTYGTLNDSQLCDEPEVVTSSAICNAEEKVDGSHVCAATPEATDSHLSTASKKGSDSERPELNTESGQQKAK